MGTADELQLIQVVEFIHNFGAEKPSSTTGADLPRVDVFRV
jgi:hypothetical protein